MISLAFAVAAGSYTRTCAPSLRRASTIAIAGDSRTSSVPPLNASPRTASFFPRSVHNALRTLAFHAVASQCGYEFGLLTEVMRINAEQRRRFLYKVRSALWTLRGKKLAVLGLAFKGGTDDVRESPAIAIVEALLREGAQVRVYDPAATAKARLIIPKDGVLYASDPYGAAEGCDALLVLTEWKEFANLDLDRVRSVLKYPIVIDGRNLYDPKEMAHAGLLYYSIE